MPPAPGPSWRGSAQSVPHDNRRSWRRPGNGSGGTFRLRSPWLKALLSLFTTLIAIASIVLFIILVFVPGCNQTHFVFLSPAPYSDGGLPPQAFAQQEREDFRSRFSAESLSDLLAATQTNSSGKKGTSKKRDRSRSILVLYVTALAGRSDAGVFLYSDNAGPDEPSGYLSLDQIWQFLGNLPPEQKKVVAIDIARGPIDWRWGQFARPDLNRKLDSQEPRDDVGAILSRVPNLAIISSAAPGEVSWSSPSLARSIFGYYLIRGLAGDADGSGSKTRDQRITLAELYHYVLTNTNNWVSQNRDLRGQHPQLSIAAASKEALMATVVAETRSTRSAAADSTKPIEGTRLRQLESLWEARERLIALEPEQSQPLAWRQFLEHLRRAEQWWLAGQPEGMEPHLQSAERLIKILDEGESNRNADLASNRFVAAGVQRRSSPGPYPDTDPVLPEKQLQITLQAFAPVTVSKVVQDAASKLRTKAEQQSWQSFRSRLWTGKLLVEADHDRRLAEDLVFVGADKELKQAETLRKSCETKLNEFEQIVRQLEGAHHLHQQLLAELPDLAWWAAQRLPVEELRSKPANSRRARIMKEYSQGIDEVRFRPPSLADQEKMLSDQDDSTLQQAEIDLLLLFEQTRELTRLLDRELEPGSSFATGTEWRDELKTLVQAITNPDRGLQAIRSRLIRHAKSLIGASAANSDRIAESEFGQTQYFHWLRLRNALQWPGLPTETRRGLFVDVEQSDRVLHGNALKTPIATSSEWSGDDWSGIDGCWQAIWALQTLSLGSADAGMHERWVLWKNAVVDENKQTTLLTQLGQSVRREFRARVEKAQPTPSATDSLEDVLRSLLIAERAARTLHGYDAVLFSLDHNPLRRLQDFDLASVCLLQADRYLEDFWGKINPNDRDPWYLQATNQCLRFVERQYDLLSIPVLKTGREEVARRIKARGTAQLKIASFDPKLDLSLENQQTLHIAASINDQVPPGVAALWTSPEDSSSRALLELIPSDRRAISQSSLNTELIVRKVSSPPATKCEEIILRPRLLFRGRYWDDQSEVIHVDPCPPTSIDIEYTYPADTGDVVVFGVDRRDTMFILDCSLSMAPPMDSKNKQGESRFQAARKALSDALRVLRDGPVLRNEKDPHVVGLMAYGHRAKAKGGDPNQTAVNLDWKLPIPSAVSEDWRNDFETLNSPERLNDEHYRRLIANLEKLQPFGQTPLLGAILSAARSLVERKHGGVIVAITDGAYNDGATNGTRYKAVQEFLQAHPELSLHIVAFGLNEQSEIASLKKLGEHTRGTYHDAPDGTRLAEAIERVMRPRKYDVVREASPRQEYVADLGEVVRGLPPHNYKVHFPDLAEFPAKLYGGERLEFDLDFANSSLKHRRPQPLLFRRAQDAAAFDRREPTRFGYLKADFDNATRRTDFLFSLDRDDQLGMIERPAEIRIDVAPRGTQLQLAHSWQLEPAQSIPVWRVRMRDWPADRTPVVQASWKMSRTEPDVQLPLAPSLKEPQSATLPGWSEGGLKVTAEKQGGTVLVRLQKREDTPNVNVAEVRVELGQISQVESRFLPTSYNWRSRLYPEQRQLTVEFDVGDSLDIAVTHLSLTSRSSLDKGSRKLESPLSIDKWDKEQ